MAAAANSSQRFCEMWAESIGSALGSYGVTSPTVLASEAISAPAPSQQEFENLVCIRFTCSGAAKGELLWVADKAGALRVAQLLTGAEPASPDQLSAEERDAFAEFLRQAAGQTASSWKAEFGSELTFAYQDTVVPAPETAHCSTLTLVGEKFASLSLRLFLDGDLHEALVAIPAPEPAPASARPASVESAPTNPIPANPAPAIPASTPSASASPAAFAPPERTEPLPTNLGLVLDVTLEATIRFGEREMLLRDIFGLMAGAVVELNQMVNAPAELHVAGRVVARGEVVVVDGNFGLRVTEVAALHDRVAVIPI